MDLDLNTIVLTIHACTSLDDLQTLRQDYVGKNGHISLAMTTLGQLDPEARKTQGQVLNQLKTAVIAALDARQTILEDSALDATLQAEALDMSLSPRPQQAGLIHPLARTFKEVCDYFTRQGFAIAEGPDIETEHNNFDALNIPAHHPARQMHDTFYVQGSERLLLRTHTSPVQVRVMTTQQPPLRIIAPGRTFRCDSDATHTPMFHQIEGLVVDQVTHMGHLKGILTDFCRWFFNCPTLTLRFRPSYFPFTEPSAEVDVACRRGKDQTTIGEGDDWMEILGCGMVHPNVLRACGIDPTQYQGYAFGMGLERLTMLKYGMTDLRKFFEGDMRWLRHYGFVPYGE